MGIAKKTVMRLVVEVGSARDFIEDLASRLRIAFSLPATACYIERHNLSVRMTVRRFTRLTNVFSKKIENHIAFVALGYFAYNLLKVHRTLSMNPAMAADITPRLWEVSDSVAECEAW